MAPSIPGFTKLNDITSLYKSTTSDATHPVSHEHPRLLVLCSWMDARPKHIAKYTSTYQTLFPSADILLVQARLTDLLFNTADHAPACEVLDSYLTSLRTTNEESSGVVLHAWSNGGATNAVQLARQFQRSHKRAPAFDKTILECCPGTADVSSVATSVAMSLPGNSLARRIGWVLVYLVATLYLVVIRALGIEDALSLNRRTLNDKEWFSPGAARLYMYSKADALVRWVDVRSHAEDARGKGFRDVREEVFERAAHVALVSEDGERYWKLVKGHFGR